MSSDSNLFDLALRAKIPVIGVQTDDLLNCTATLQLLANRKVSPLPTLKTVLITSEVLYWTEQVEDITVERYRKLTEAGAQVVVVNQEKQSNLVFSTGQLPTAIPFLHKYLSEFVSQESIPQLLLSLGGLSLKASSEIVQLTMARSGAVTPHEVRATRQMLGTQTQGFQILDSTYDFYIMPEPLLAWLKLNESFFLDDLAPTQLVPRGLLLSGKPGVGKSMFSKVIASHWKLPLVRLDIPGSLNRMLGESEARISRSLAAVEQYAPCVLLLDEVEKLFGNDDEGGTTARILSQLLWWLQEHKAKVLTLMTTNLSQQIPPELYREGRIDAVIEIPLLSQTDAAELAAKVFKSVLKRKPDLTETAALSQEIETKKLWAHAELTQGVYRLIKTHGWYQEQNTLAFV